MDPIDFVKLKLTKLFRGKADKKISLPLGVYEKNDQIYLLLQNRATPGTIDTALSQDGFSFDLNDSTFSLTQEFKNTYLGNISLFTLNKSQYILCKNRRGVFVGQINNAIISLFALPEINEKAAIVDNFAVQSKYVMYVGERAIRIAYSSDLRSWNIANKPVLVDASPIEVGSVFTTEHGILLLYFKKTVTDGRLLHSAYLALFDKSNPERLLWNTPSPVWEEKNHWEKTHAQYLGTVRHKGKLISYWKTENQGVFGVLITGFTYNPELMPKRIKLQKHAANPIISPKADNNWEAFNTFNPAALYADKKVHILYRAQGFDYVSTVGYAVSHDGINIHERSQSPVYTPQMKFENNDRNCAKHDFMSGGGMGGCEDPRITLLDDTVYMTYVAFDGWSPPRLALTSILLEDFLNKRWLWTKPVLISPPGIIDKSGCLLPEKINGKYVFFHRVFPNILIDYVDNLDFDGKTNWLKGQYQIKIRDNMWDSRKIGAGAPPLKTKDGWLLIYYGVDDRDASKYHIGAMLLDLKDPTRVLHRSNNPILEPTDIYENNGFKPGIAYPCGAVIIKDKLFVYYGGADSVVCVATAHLDTFLDELKSKESGTLTKIQVQEVDY